MGMGIITIKVSNRPTAPCGEVVETFLNGHCQCVDTDSLCADLGPGHSYIEEEPVFLPVITVRKKRNMTKSLVNHCHCVTKMHSLC